MQENPLDQGDEMNFGVDITGIFFRSLLFANSRFQTSQVRTVSTIFHASVSLTMAIGW